MLNCQLGDEGPIRRLNRITGSADRMGPRLRRGSDASSDFIKRHDAERLQFNAEFSRCLFGLLELQCKTWIPWVPHEGYARQAGNSVPDQLQSLRCKFCRLQAEPRNISTGSREAGDQPCPDRISDGGHDDRDCLRQFLQSLNRRCARGYDYVAACDELGGRLGKSVGVVVWVLDFECNVELLHPTKFAKPLLEHLDLASNSCV